jgi:hypothetical protein
MPGPSPGTRDSPFDGLAHRFDFDEILLEDGVRGQRFNRVVLHAIAIS